MCMNVPWSSNSRGWGGIVEIATGETRWLQNSFGILQDKVCSSVILFLREMSTAGIMIGKTRYLQNYSKISHTKAATFVYCPFKQGHLILEGGG